MIPILSGSFGYYSLFIHRDIFTSILEKYVLTCIVGTRIEVYGCTEEEGYVSLEFERTKTGFLFSVERNNKVRANFILKYVSEESG
ncbi:hypothetical protein TNCV_3136271 [Trichonephila clavipes]|nr:hypothetical protein TNCV_3136271 [Trichonephila clavipes]